MRFHRPDVVCVGISVKAYLTFEGKNVTITPSSRLTGRPAAAGSRTPVCCARGEKVTITPPSRLTGRPAAAGARTPVCCVGARKLPLHHQADRLVHLLQPPADIEYYTSLFILSHLELQFVKSNLRIVIQYIWT